MTLARTLLLLWLLALATTALTLAAERAPQAALGATVLALAWLKARLILTGYLEIDTAPGWRAGLSAALAFILAICWLLGLGG